MAKTAVVILNFNGVEYLKKFLPQIISFSPSADILVADNCSSDTSLDYLGTLHSVQTIELSENFGFTGGYNRVLKNLKYEYCVLLNSDVEVTKGWLEPLVKKLDTDSKVIACQPKILSYHDKSKFEYAGASGGFIDKLGYPYCRGRIFETLEEDSGQYDDDIQIHWTTGACMIIRTEEFNSVGGFDEDFFAHMEEIDLCWRLNLAGKKLFCIPQSVVYHVGGGTLDKANPRKTFLNFRNNLSMLFKNESPSSLIWKLPVKLGLDWIAGFKFWLDNSFDHFKAVLSAHFYFFTHLSLLLKKRKLVNKLRKNNNKLQAKGIIVFQYFLFGKKKYSDL